MKYSDQPISRPGQDVLGRGPFALQLARAIDALVASEGFVLAIVGEWGAGKTSVIQLVLRYLQHIEMERASQSLEASDGSVTILQLEEMSSEFEKVEPHIIALETLNKNVRYWQRLNQLDSFRRWLPTDTDVTAADRYWRLKCQVDDNRHTIVLRFSPWLVAGRAELAAALISELARELGAHLGDEIKEAFAGILQRLSELAPIAGTGLDLAAGGGGSIVRLGGSYSSKLANKLVSGPTLDDLRQRLRTVLNGLNDQRVLVVVDDLDRLTPPEALEMMSLIKSVGDLPNVIYLLSYDEEMLTELIKEATGLRGGIFLEKIVQYPIHLPILRDSDLSRLLDSDLTTILGPLESHVTKRLSSTWYYVFRHYLTTPRRVRRFINSVSVAHSALVGHTDPVDLLFIELMRLHEPAIYSWLRRNLDSVAE